MLFTVTGCSVNIGGRERPLLRHGRIEGDVELIGEFDRNASRSGVETKSETLVFEERLNLWTSGDLYHPNLMLYSAALGLGLNQQQVDSDDRGGGTGDLSEKTNGFIDEYSLSGTILQKKDYPFSYSFNKTENLISRHFYGPLRATDESEYYNLIIRNESFPMTFRYDKHSTEQSPVSASSLSGDTFSRTNKTFKYGVKHDFTKYSRMKFTFDRRESESSTLNSQNFTATDSYDLSHSWQLGERQEGSLNSSISFRDQTIPVLNKNLRWNEDLTIQHSKALRTYYSFLSTKKTREGLEDNETRYRAGLTHKLYQSLVTNVNIYGANLDFQGKNQQEQRGGDLSFNYNKKNRWGSIFANYSVSLNSLEQSGSGTSGIVDDELHTIPIGFTFFEVELRQINIDETSIFVTDIADNLLTSPDDYTIIPSAGGITKLRLSTLGINGNNIAAGDTVKVDYTFFVESKRSEDTVNQQFLLGHQFNNGLSIYAKHRRQNEDVTSSDPDVVADNTRTNTLTADYIKGGFALAAEYTETESTIENSESTNIRAQYHWDIDDTKTVSVWGSKSVLTTGGSQDRETEMIDFGSEFYWRLSDKYHLTADIDYVNETDTLFGDTEGIEFNSELGYNYRQFSFLTGLEYSLLTRSNSETETLFLYMRIRRTF